MELNNFNIFDKVPNDLKLIIKSFYVLENYFPRLQTALFVTIDDKVFGFGYNDNGICGQGYHRSIDEPLVITVLSNKQGLVQDYSQRLIEGNIYRQKLSRLKLSRLKPHRARLSRLGPMG